MKKALENELSDLIRKYMNELNAWEITESIIGFVTSCACSAAYRNNELDIVDQDLKKIIDDTVKVAKLFYSTKKQSN
jgi:hypothetical protein